MINADLFYVLLGISNPTSPFKAAYNRTTPQTIASRYLGKGYAAEFYEWGGKSQRISWFWGPGEFIIPTSPYSTVKMLDEGTCVHMTYGNMISILKKHDDARAQYKHFREQHNIAIAERIKEIKTKTPLEVYVNLISKKPWVLEQVSQEDLASYLNVDLKTLKEFSNMKA
ncbi:hypothetical protein GFS24_23785 [Chitinophaga sp. SYP-B3965]|uniref:hypothetical protein n=1 Tax=Chitinophaga sp. SYP-B3965 TaxID=2663120 RepID=UPI001299E4DB|nr:hypothetical protein [Chitinophaga sp. SYP-B3965]MRG48162.1 hypothetical protein [Chitinophaga sp. SYP-B3965]